MSKHFFQQSHPSDKVQQKVPDRGPLGGPEMLCFTTVIWLPNAWILLQWLLICWQHMLRPTSTTCSLVEQIRLILLFEIYSWASCSGDSGTHLKPSPSLTLTTFSQFRQCFRHTAYSWSKDTYIDTRSGSCSRTYNHCFTHKTNTLSSEPEKQTT